MLKLYIRPVCFQRPEEEENSLSLLVESRREKVRTIKGKENRSRSIAAGLLLRHMSADEYAPFEANRNFFYLTGLRRERMILLMKKTKRDPKEILFIEEADPTQDPC